MVPLAPASVNMDSSGAKDVVPAQLKEVDLAFHFFR